MRGARRILLTAAMVLGLAVVPSVEAQALGGEYLGCRVLPADHQAIFTAFSCDGGVPSGTYWLTFRVLGTTGSHTYSWDTGGVPPQYGCTTSSPQCDLSVSGQTDRHTTVTVTITQNGQSAVISATATTYCARPWSSPGSRYDWIFC
jgi:hypothetical protein